VDCKVEAQPETEAGEFVTVLHHGLCV